MSKLSFAKPRRRLNFALVRSIAVWIFQIAIVCLIAFVCIWFFGQRVSTIGDSMKPVLRNGDIVLVTGLSMMQVLRTEEILLYSNQTAMKILILYQTPDRNAWRKGFDSGWKIYIDGKELEEEEYTTTEIEEAGIAAEEIQLSVMSILCWVITERTVKTAGWLISAQ